MTMIRSMHSMAIDHGVAILLRPLSLAMAHCVRVPVGGSPEKLPNVHMQILNNL